MKEYRSESECRRTIRDASEAYDCKWTGHFDEIGEEAQNLTLDILRHFSFSFEVGRSNGDSLYISEVFGGLHFLIHINGYKEDFPKLSYYSITILPNWDGLGSIRPYHGKDKEIVLSYLEQWERFKEKVINLQRTQLASVHQSPFDAYKN